MATLPFELRSEGARLWLGEDLPHFDKLFPRNFPLGESRLQNRLGVGSIPKRSLRGLGLRPEDTKYDINNQEKNQAPYQQGQ